MKNIKKALSSLLVAGLLAICSINTAGADWDTLGGTWRFEGQFASPGSVITGWETGRLEIYSYFDDWGYEYIDGISTSSTLQWYYNGIYDEEDYVSGYYEFRPVEYDPSRGITLRNNDIIYVIYQTDRDSIQIDVSFPMVVEGRVVTCAGRYYGTRRHGGGGGGCNAATGALPLILIPLLSFKRRKDT